MQPQYDPNDPEAIIPVQEDMIEAAPGEQLVKNITPHLSSYIIGFLTGEILRMKLFMR